MSARTSLFVSISALSVSLTAVFLSRRMSVFLTVLLSTNLSLMIHSKSADVFDTLPSCLSSDVVDVLDEQSEVKWKRCRGISLKYTAVLENMDFDEAVVKCSSLGAEGATVADPQNVKEHRCVRDVIVKNCTPEQYWLGYRRTDGANAAFASVRDGSEMAWARWHCGEPREKRCTQATVPFSTGTCANAENCNDVYSCTYWWDDVHCQSSKMRKFVCQADVDECADNIHDCNMATMGCNNTYGSFECFCLKEGTSVDNETITASDYYNCEAPKSDNTALEKLTTALNGSSFTVTDFLDLMDDVSQLHVKNPSVTQKVAHAASKALSQLNNGTLNRDLLKKVEDTLHRFSSNILDDNISESSNGIGIVVSVLGEPSSSRESSATAIISQVHGEQSDDSSAESAPTVHSDQPSSGKVDGLIGKRKAAVLIFGYPKLFQTNQRLQFPSSCEEAAAGDTSMYFLNSDTYSARLSGDNSHLVKISLEFKAKCAGQEPYCGRYDLLSAAWKNDTCKKVDLGSAIAIAQGQKVYCQCTGSGHYGLFTLQIDDSQSEKELDNIKAAFVDRGSNSDGPSAAAVSSAASTLDTISSQPSTSKKVGQLIVDVVNLILATTPTTTLQQSQRTDNGISRMLQSIDKYYSHVLLKENEVRHTNGSMFSTRVEAVPVGAATPEQTYSFGRNQPVLAPAEDANYSTTTNENGDLSSAEVFLPENITSLVSLYPGQPYVPVQLSKFNSTKFFTPQATLDGEDEVLATTVVVISVGNSSLQLGNATMAVNFTTRLSGKHPRCVFWNFMMNGGLGGWSSNGCLTLGNLNATVNASSTVSCQCNHLTHFAVLLSGSPPEGGHHVALELITKIGCSASLISLLLTILVIVFCSSKKSQHAIQTKATRLKAVTAASVRRKNEAKRVSHLPTPHKILLNFCLSLMAVLVLVVIGVEPNDGIERCAAASALLHYFLLSTFLWMLMEGINMYVQLVRVINTGGQANFMKIAVITAWGVPAVVVGAIAAISMDSYRPRVLESLPLCRVHGLAYEFALFVPLCVILLVNFITFILVMRTLHMASSMERRTQSLKKRAKHKNGQRRRNLIRSMTFASLLGLTWVTGLFMINENSIFLQYIFTVLVSLQGFSIFLLQCLANRTIRARFISCLLCRSASDEGQSTSRTGTVSSTVSTSTLGNSVNHPKLKVISFSPTTTSQKTKSLSPPLDSSEVFEVKHLIKEPVEANDNTTQTPSSAASPSPDENISPVQELDSRKNSEDTATTNLGPNCKTASAETASHLEVDI